MICNKCNSEEFNQIKSYVFGNSIFKKLKCNKCENIIEIIDRID